MLHAIIGKNVHFSHMLKTQEKSQFVCRKSHFPKSQVPLGSHISQEVSFPLVSPISREVALLRKASMKSKNPCNPENHETQKSHFPESHISCHLKLFKQLVSRNLLE